MNEIPHKKDRFSALRTSILEWFNTNSSLIQNELSNSQLFAARSSEKISNVDVVTANSDPVIATRETTAFKITAEGANDQGNPANEELLVKRSVLVSGRDPRIIEAQGHFLQQAAGLPKIGKYFLPLFVHFIDDAKPADAASVEIMPFCSGGNLSQRLLSGEVNSWAEVHKAIQALCEVLSFLHRNHKIHGDFKLDSFLLHNDVYAAADFLQSMFDVDFDDLDSDDAKKASLSKTSAYADDRFFTATDKIKDFGFDYYALAVCIYQLFNQHALPYLDPSQSFSPLGRVPSLFQNAYHPTADRIPVSEEYAQDYPELATQLQKIKIFVNELDNYLKEALTRHDPTQPDPEQAPTKQFYGYDNRMVKRLYTKINDLIAYATNAGVNFDLMIKILNLRPYENEMTKERLVALFRDSRTVVEVSVQETFVPNTSMVADVLPADLRRPDISLTLPQVSIAPNSVPKERKPKNNRGNLFSAIRNAILALKGNNP